MLIFYRPLACSLSILYFFCLSSQILQIQVSKLTHHHYFIVNQNEKLNGFLWSRISWSLLAPVSALIYTTVASGELSTAWVICTFGSLFVAGLPSFLSLFKYSKLLLRKELLNQTLEYACVLAIITHIRAPLRPPRSLSKSMNEYTSREYSILLSLSSKKTEKISSGSSLPSP